MDPMFTLSAATASTATFLADTRSPRLVVTAVAFSLLAAGLVASGDSVVGTTGNVISNVTGSSVTVTPSMGTRYPVVVSASTPPAIASLAEALLSIRNRAIARGMRLLSMDEIEAKKALIRGES